jgi:exodeoxyribonuclease VII large subunit
MQRDVLSVSALNEYVRRLMDGDALLGGLCVRGELSNYKIYPSGHHYFTLKDEGGALRCVMFRSSAEKLRFRPENGMRVLASGRVSVYPRDGAYQLYCASLTPDGVGDLHAAFEQLKAKLEAEGLFEQRYKKPLPAYPKRIAVITSGAGAAVRDSLRILRARWPMAAVVVLPVRVQGAEAPPEIVGALRYANRHRLADLIICGRGGGSIEDLWAFNDERVARAIYESDIPVISAVGHEPDFTIADFAADLRAATPSNGAELAVPDQAELRSTIGTMEKRMRSALSARLSSSRERLRQLRERRVMTDPGAYVADRRIALDHSSALLAAAFQGMLGRKRTGLAGIASALDAMSPLKVLGRGYAIAEREDGRILRSREEAAPGDRLRLRLADGALLCQVREEEDTADGNGKEKSEL